MSEIAITADIHGHKYADEKNHISFDTIICVLYQIFQHCYDNNITTLIIAGDLFHIRGKIHSFVFNRIYDIFKEATENGLKIVIVSGNHDHTFNEDAQTSSIYSLKEIKGVRIADFERFTIENCEITCVPYIETQQDFDEAILEFDHEENDLKKILITHGIVKDAVLNNGRAFDKGIGGSLFSYYDRVVVGHIHHPQELRKGKLWIPGAPLCHNKKDVGSLNRGFSILNTKTGKMSRVETDHPQFVMERVKSKKKLLKVFSSTKDTDFLYLQILTRIPGIEKILKDREGFVEYEFCYEGAKKEKRLDATLGDSEPEIVGDYIKKYAGDLNNKLLQKLSDKLFEEYETVNEIV